MQKKVEQSLGGGSGSKVCLHSKFEGVGKSFDFYGALTSPLMED